MDKKRTSLDFMPEITQKTAVFLEGKDLGKGEVRSSILRGSTIATYITCKSRNLLLSTIGLGAHSYMCREAHKGLPTLALSYGGRVLVPKIHKSNFSPQPEV